MFGVQVSENKTSWSDSDSITVQGTGTYVTSPWRAMQAGGSAGSSWLGRGGRAAAIIGGAGGALMGYTGSVSGVLKNAIDWATRPISKDEVPLSCFIGKIGVLMSAAPGGLGGLRGLVHLREILTNLGVFVLPQQYLLPYAFRAFNEDTLADPKAEAQVMALGGLLAKTVRALSHLSPQSGARTELSPVRLD